jgi:hypothetical protein
MRENHTSKIRPNEARPVFRALSGAMGLAGLAVGGISTYFTVTEHNWPLFWQLGVTGLVFGTIFTFVAVTGYIPRWLLWLFGNV